MCRGGYLSESDRFSGRRPETTEQQEKKKGKKPNPETQKHLTETKEQPPTANTQGSERPTLLDTLVKMFPCLSFWVSALELVRAEVCSDLIDSLRPSGLEASNVQQHDWQSSTIGCGATTSSEPTSRKRF